jgi:predicted RNase H-like HicB family nuclease
MSETPRYHINLFWYPPDLCWIADVPDLRPCSARGATPVEAAAAISLAIEAWIAAAQSAGLPVPDPRYSPALFAAA